MTEIYRSTPATSTELHEVSPTIWTAWSGDVSLQRGSRLTTTTVSMHHASAQAISALSGEIAVMRESRIAIVPTAVSI